MPHFMIVLMPDIYLLNLSWIINCLILRNMDSLSIYVYIIPLVFLVAQLVSVSSLSHASLVFLQIHKRHAMLKDVLGHM